MADGGDHRRRHLRGCGQRRHEASRQESPPGVRLPHGTTSWLAVAYLALVGSVVAFLIYFSLLKTWDSTTVSFFGVFTPAIALFLGAAVLGERLSRWSLAGSALILAGVLMTLLTSRRAPRPHAPR